MQCNNILRCSDAIRLLGGLDSDSIDAVITDPPYLIGFMNKSWDSADNIAGKPDVWREALRVLKPGGHLLCFGATKTHHRVWSAIEESGFEIRDTLAWLYGTGFPKGKANLKPAHEPICLARKPFKGSATACHEKHGTACLNIDACRIAGEPWEPHIATGLASTKFFSDGERPEIEKNPHPGGRWPANVCLDEDGAQLLDEQTGPLKSGKIAKPYQENHVNASSFRFNRQKGTFDYGGSGKGPSKFFYVAKASTRERNQGLGEGLKNLHPTVKPVALMRWLIELVTMPGASVVDPFMGSGTTGVAAASLGRCFIGGDSDPESVSIAEKRIEAATKPAARSPQCE